MRFYYYFGNREGELTPTLKPRDGLEPLISLGAVNATKPALYDIYSIIDKYIDGILYKISAHREIVYIDNVKEMLDEIKDYIENNYNLCSIRIFDGEGDAYYETKIFEKTE